MSPTEYHALSLTNDAEAAVIQFDVGVAVGYDDVEVELLQRPAVGLGHVLAGGRDVGLGQEQTAQPHLEITNTVTGRP